MASTVESGTRKLAAIMFTDIKSFSKKMGEDEVRAMEILRIHDTMMREVIAKYGGTVIKSIGDSFMVDFSSAVTAVKCAIEAQENFWYYNQGKNEFERIEVRIGIHLGDVMIVGNDIFGDGVNIASRIEAITEPTRICVSQDIYNQIKNKMAIRAYSIGSIELKNIAEPVEVFEVLIDSIPELSQPSRAAQELPSRKRTETITRQEAVEARKVEETRARVDEEQQKREAEKQRKADELLVRAQAYFDAGDLDRAEEEIKSIYRTVSIHYGAQMLLLQIEEERTKQEEEERRRRLKEEKKRREEERQARIQAAIQKAIQHVEQDRFDDALAALQEAYTIDPKYAEAKQLEEQIQQARQAKAELDQLQALAEQRAREEEQREQEAREALERAKALITEKPAAPVGAPKKPAKFYVAIGAGAVLVLALAVSISILVGILSKPDIVVVVPFTVEGPPEGSSFENGTWSFLGKAVATAVAENIAHARQLTVISPSSSNTLGESATVTDAGSAFGARYAVLGSIVQTGQRFELRARLIEVETNKSLWESTFESDLLGVTEMAGKVASATFTALDLDASPPPPPRLTSNPTAYESYLRGMLLLDGRTMESIDNGLAAIRTSLQFDSTFAQALAALGRGLLTKYRREGERDRALVTEALAAGRAAAALNQSAALAYQVLGEAYRIMQQYRNSRDAIERSLALQPGNAECYRQLALLAMMNGAYNSAEEEAGTALRVDPRHPDSHFVMGLLYLYRKDFEKASLAFEKASEHGAEELPLITRFTFNTWINLGQDAKVVEYCEQLMTDALPSRKVVLYYWIGRAQQMVGKLQSLRSLDDGIATADTVLSATPNNVEVLGYLALLYSRRGNFEAALRQITRAESLAPNSPRVHYWKARVYAIQKDKENAIANLARAISLEYDFSEVLDPDFLSVQREPEYTAAIARKSIPTQPAE